MTETWVMLVDEDGIVRSESPAARAAMGTVRGRRCADVVRLGDPLEPCSRSCAGELLHGNHGRDRHGPVGPYAGARVLCAPTDAGVVVTVVPATDAPRPAHPLSAREREVLALVAHGLTTEEIALYLDRASATIRTHIEHAREKLGARTRAEAVSRALATGELDPNAVLSAH